MVPPRGLPTSGLSALAEWSGYVTLDDVKRSSLAVALVPFARQRIVGRELGIGSALVKRSGVWFEKFW